jgi:UDP:flavonoid glycosyltransferase YjiC (YdhE family)
MRVLFAAVPEDGHVNPLLPLAEALAGAGHQVAFASSAEYCSRLGDRFATFEAGPEFPLWYEEMFAREGHEGHDVPPDRILQHWIPRLFAKVGLDLTKDALKSAVQRFSPDLVVCDLYHFGAPLVAAEVGLPCVAHAIGPLPDLEVFELSGEAAASAWEHKGLSPRRFGGILDAAWIGVAPLALEDVEASPARKQVFERRIAMRPPLIAPDHGYGLPPEVDALPRPLVYLTMGTLLNTVPEVFRTVMEALAGMELSLVVTVGRDRDPEWVGPPPENAFIARYIPQHLLLPRVDLVISHGGGNTILPSLARGIPLVILPQGADNYVNAWRAEKAGVAQVLTLDRVRVEDVRRAVTEVLTKASYASAARSIAEEIASLPEPSMVAARLENMVASGRGFR